MRQSSLAQGVLVILLIGCCALPAQAQEVVETVFFDSMTSANGIERTIFNRTGRTTAIDPDTNNEFGRSFTGNPLNTSELGSITLIDFYLSATATPLTSYQSIQVNLQFWDTFSGPGTTWFNNQLGSTSAVFNTLAVLPSNISFVESRPGGGAGDQFDVYRVSLALDLPISFSDISLNGVTLNVKGNNGAGFFNTNNLSSVRTRGNGYLVGSSPATDQDPDDGGYVRNYSGRTDGNFSRGAQPGGGFDLISGADMSYESLGMRLYRQDIVVVPETNTLALLVVGALLPTAGLIRRRRK